MARKAFLIARALSKKVPDEPIDAIVLIWDTDQQRDERPEGVEAARDEARRWAPFQIVCGFPDPEREAWVLAGFDPCDDAERARLEELHHDLGFSPVHHAHRLRDKNAGAPRNIKRVLRVLTGNDPAARSDAGPSRRSPRCAPAAPTPASPPSSKKSTPSSSLSSIRRRRTSTGSAAETTRDRPRGAGMRAQA